MSTYHVPGFLAFFFIVNICHTDAGPTCLSCTHIVQPRDCFKLAVCGDHEQCFMKRYVTSSGKFWYDVGCLDTTKCAPLSGGVLPFGKREEVTTTSLKYWTHPPSVIGRRQVDNSDQVVCEHCCNGTICNSGGYCGADPLDKPGPLCYSCDQASSADGCDRIEQCGENEKCYIGQKLNPVSQEFRWTHGCRSNNTCVHSQDDEMEDDDESKTKICDDCCDHNLCNNVCTNFVDWNAPVTTMSSNTTVAMTTTPLETAVPEITTMKATQTTTEAEITTMRPTQTTTEAEITTMRPTTAEAVQTTTYVTTMTSTTKMPETTTYTTTHEPTTIIHTTLDPVTMVDCDFESGICNWHQDPTDDGDWRIHSGPTATENTGPMNDHTFETENGHYIYLEASDLSYMNKVRLISNPIVWPGNSCLTFWYHMHGRYIASLTIKIKTSDGNSQKLWSMSGDQGDKWLSAIVHLPNTPGTIVIEGFRGADVHGDIAVDDIKLLPSCKVTSPFPIIDCDFESGLCNWHQDPIDDGDWNLHSGPTPTENTGPMTDHTFGTENGRYIYLEASDLSYMNKVRLISNLIEWPANSCLSLWYHMHGRYIASLTVKVKTSDGNSQQLWSASGDQGDKWLSAIVHLPTTPGTIVIEGLRGADVHGDIAVDDIKLVPNCHVPFITTTQLHVPSQFPYSVTMIDCDFESSLCNWQQDQTDDGDWRLHSGPTATQNTGPLNDHTYGTVNGHYIYLEASDLNYMNKIRLISNPIVWPGNSCLSLWYHMHGGSITINVKTSDGNLQQIWSLSGDQGDHWLSALIHLPNTPGTIVIEGRRGADPRGDIAVDDIKLLPNCEVQSLCEDKPGVNCTILQESHLDVCLGRLAVEYCVQFCGLCKPPVATIFG